MIISIARVVVAAVVVVVEERVGVAVVAIWWQW